MTVADSIPRVGPSETSSRLAQAPRRCLPRDRLGWCWLWLGLVGTLAITIASPRLTGEKWWFELRMPLGYGGNSALLYLGIASLSVAWLGVGARLTRPREMQLSELWTMAAIWSLPLLLAPPVFSLDVFSYLAQGAIFHLGHNPYQQAPAVLAQLGQRHLLDAVSPFWRHSTAPYGPAFIAISGGILAVSGSHLVLAAILERALELVGILLLALFIPRLARRLGADQVRATWVAVISPLVLCQLIGAGHNDALMAGMMVAGVTMALERRPALGIVICAAAATIKLPALVAAAFIAVAWARSVPGTAARLRILAEASLIVVAVIGAVSLSTGLGLDWVSTSLFSTPAKVHIAITPTTAIARTLAPPLGASWRAFAGTLGVVAAAATALLGVAMIWRVRFENLVRCLGLLLLVAALAGPVAWPWYFVWGLALIAACPEWQWSRAIPVAVVLAVFVVKANGSLLIHLWAAPYVLLIYVVLAGILWQRWRRRRARLTQPRG